VTRHTLPALALASAPPVVAEAALVVALEA
jgi:hypothetical protein